MQASTASAESGCAARRAGGGGRGGGSCGVRSNRSRDREHHRRGTGSGEPPHPVAKDASHPIAQCLQGFCLCSRPVGAHDARHPHPETLGSTCGDITCEAPRCRRISAVVPKFLCCSNQEACRRQQDRWVVVCVDRFERGHGPGPCIPSRPSARSGDPTCPAGHCAWRSPFCRPAKVNLLTSLQEGS